MDEFLARTEETLSQDNACKHLAKIEKDIRALETKRAKLIDMRLEEMLDKDSYESKYLELACQIDQLQDKQRDLQSAAETESTMKSRIAEFRKTLEQNSVLEKFDRYVFESIVEKVIVGGYDKDGRKDPYKMTFIYKTGFQSQVDGANFKPPRKNSKAAKASAKLCSYPTDGTKTMPSYHVDDTCGDSCPLVSRSQTINKRRKAGRDRPAFPDSQRAPSDFASSAHGSTVTWNEIVSVSSTILLSAATTENRTVPVTAAVPGRQAETVQLSML